MNLRIQWAFVWSLPGAEIWSTPSMQYIHLYLSKAIIIILTGRPLAQQLPVVAGNCHDDHLRFEYNCWCCVSWLFQRDVKTWECTLCPPQYHPDLSGNPSPRRSNPNNKKSSNLLPIGLWWVYHPLPFCRWVSILLRIIITIIVNSTW